MSHASPGKVNEPGLLAGDAGTELQNEVELPLVFGPGLQGGIESLKAGVANGEAMGETVPGLGLTSASGATVARGIWALPTPPLLSLEVLSVEFVCLG